MEGGVLALHELNPLLMIKLDVLNSAALTAYPYPTTKRLLSVWLWYNHLS